MFKVLILFFVAVWLLSMCMSNRRKVIRDTSHLLQLIFWAVLVFSGNTLLMGISVLREQLLLRALCMLLLFWAAWYVSRWFVGLAEHSTKKRH